MKENIGGIDRNLRLIVGILILAIGIAYESLWGLVGLIPIATAFMKWCPAYLPFGISTCKVKEKP